MRINVAPLAALALAVVSAGALAQSSAPKYRLELIDPLPGAMPISTLRVNESGLVSAFGSTSPFDRQSIRWSAPGQFAVTPTARGLAPIWPTNDGRLVGPANNPTGMISLALDGSYTQLTTVGAGQYKAVGAVAPNGDYTGTDDFNSQHGYRIRNGVYSNLTLDTAYARFGQFVAMNDAGTVLGNYLDPSGSGNYFPAWIARGGVSTTLPQTVDGISGRTNGVDLDSTGRVLGSLTRNGRSYPVIWGADNAPSLVPEPTGYTTTATAFNASGTILGSYARAGGLPGSFIGLTTPTGTYDWADTIEGGAAGWRVQGLVDISDSGYIVGFGQINGVDRAFRMTPLTPVPEPATLAGIALGTAALRRRRRKRAPSSPAC